MAESGTEVCWGMAGWSAGMKENPSLIIYEVIKLKKKLILESDLCFGCSCGSMAKAHMSGI